MTCQSDRNKFILDLRFAAKESKGESSIFRTSRSGANKLYNIYLALHTRAPVRSCSSFPQEECKLNMRRVGGKRARACKRMQAWGKAVSRQANIYCLCRWPTTILNRDKINMCNIPPTSFSTYSIYFQV